jgi:hypothetical protein
VTTTRPATTNRLAILFGTIQTNVKFMDTAPHPNRRPAGNGLGIHVGAVIVFTVVAIACALYTMVVTMPPINTLMFAVLGLGTGACAVKIMGSVSPPPVPPPPITVTDIPTDASDDLLAIVSLMRVVTERRTLATGRH